GFGESRRPRAKCGRVAAAPTLDERPQDGGRAFAGGTPPVAPWLLGGRVYGFFFLISLPDIQVLESPACSGGLNKRSVCRESTELQTQYGQDCQIWQPASPVDSC